jgi:hypothetical protein
MIWLTTDFASWALKTRQQYLNIFRELKKETINPDNDEGVKVFSEKWKLRELVTTQICHHKF